MSCAKHQTEPSKNGTSVALVPIASERAHRGPSGAPRKVTRAGRREAASPGSIPHRTKTVSRLSRSCLTFRQPDLSLGRPLRFAVVLALATVLPLNDGLLRAQGGQRFPGVPPVELPVCGRVALDASHAGKSIGSARSYSLPMRTEHVEAAIVQLGAVWDGRRATSYAPLHVVMFDHIQGPFGQIVSKARLESPGLVALRHELEAAAIIEAQRVARFAVGIDGQRPPAGTKVVAPVILLADTRLPLQPVRLGIRRMPTALSPLLQDALLQDMLGAWQDLQRNPPSDKELESALELAISDPFDPTDMIQLLVLAGADVNSLSDQSNSMLMVAALRGDECAISALLRNGARANERNAQGLTALDIAKRVGRPGPIRVLTEANPKKR